ncbi:MAG TPA: hypothetical protein VGP94_12215, partial [Tepidisphaeraceae bacterium]|nr:hypothetical protein [Tepidisphaeraceae bacterium]
MHIWQKALLALVWLSASSQAEEVRWFGKQAAPKVLVRAIPDQGGVAMQMMVQSVAGLAAKAV